MNVPPVPPDFETFQDLIEKIQNYEEQASGVKKSGKKDRLEQIEVVGKPQLPNIEDNLPNTINAMVVKKEPPVLDLLEKEIKAVKALVDLKATVLSYQYPGRWERLLERISQWKIGSWELGKKLGIQDRKTLVAEKIERCLQPLRKAIFEQLKPQIETLNSRIMAFSMEVYSADTFDELVQLESEYRQLFDDTKRVDADAQKITSLKSGVQALIPEIERVPDYLKKMLESAEKTIRAKKIETSQKLVMELEQKKNRNRNWKRDAKALYRRTTTNATKRNRLPSRRRGTASSRNYPIRRKPGKTS